MHYEGAIFRPPSEASSILLQVTTGCSHNGCSFCGAYKNKTFRIKDDEIILQDIKYAALHFGESRRLFLCDGDALIIPQNRLEHILENIRTFLPRVQRIGSYANAKSLSRKTDGDLSVLKELGLGMIHMGLESGDDETLKAMGKWGSADEIVSQGQRAKDAGINLFVTVILGLGGIERSKAHAKRTGEALTRLNPPYVGALSLMPVEGTPLYERLKKDEFRLPDSHELLYELRDMLAYTELRPGLFYANHASNYLPLKVRFPHDKTSALAMIDSALRGEIPLTPEWLWGL